MAVHRIIYLNNAVETKQRDILALMEKGWEIIPASSIKHAIGFMRVVRPDVVITAHQLPDGDADHLLQTIRSSNEFEAIPVVVLIGQNDSNQEAHMRQLGAVDVVSQDQDRSELVDIVNNQIELHSATKEESAMGITGQLARLGIIELISAMVNEHGTGVISIDGSTTMEIHLKNGQIVHSRHGITVGKKALYRCLRIAEAAYHFSKQPVDVEATISGDLTALIETARESNQRLMANSHLLPQPHHRIRINFTDELKSTNLKAEARAALEVIKRFPRVKDYVDRFNVPDTICYEYLMTFTERGFITISDEKRPVVVITDSSADLADSLRREGVQQILLRLDLDNGQHLTDSVENNSKLLGYKVKQLTNATIKTATNDAFLERNLTHVRTHDCLSLFPATELVPTQVPAMRNLVKLRQVGFQGQPLLASELMYVETKTFSIGLGLAAYQAAIMAKRQQPVEAIHDYLNELVSRIYVVVAVQSGRSPMAPKGTSTMISTWDKDHFKALEEIPKGQSIIESMSDIVRQRIDVKSQIRMAVGHINAAKVADKLHETLQERFHASHRFEIAELGPVTTSIVGDGAIVLAFHQL